MANSVTLTKRLSNSGWSITGALRDESTIPKDIFVYENTGTEVLGPFHSVAMIDDLSKIPVWSGVAVPISRAKFVRASTVKINLESTQDVDSVLLGLRSSLTKFVKEFNSERESTQIYVLD